MKPDLSLETSIQYLKGVGPALAATLSKRSLRTVGDLVHYFPRAFEDRRAARNIASLNPDDLVSLKATVVKVSSYNMGRSSRKIWDVVIRDSSGQIHCKFFRVPYKGYFERFEPGKEVRVVGRVILYRNVKEFHHPELRDLVSEEEIADDLIPIYTEIETLTSTRIAQLIRKSLEQLKAESWGPEKLPQSLIEKRGLLTHKDALLSLHQPPHEGAEQYFEMRSPAHRRIIFEEFFWLELFLATRKSEIQREKSPKLQSSEDLVEMLEEKLPFKLTGAQKRVFSEIRKDLGSGHPMHRLVQGDVGSGKTMVAFLSAILAQVSGFQTAIMAPTEILAEQHLKTARLYLEPLGLRVGGLLGKTKAADRKVLFKELFDGTIDVLIGTHALIEDEVKFKNLGLVVIDEQHRFGVEQRAKLRRKGTSPHFLVMTATPIPRTLAMTVYGDLDVSVVDEIPPGRKPVQTRVVYSSKRPEVLKFLKAQIEKGRQAYWVFPLVDESEKMDLKNAMEEYEKLKTEFPDLKFGLLHGKMKSEEKDAIMEEFRAHKIQILVSTTVIEVGVDVPNSNLMIVEHAERFGLSQLHQLRGRVGRGEHKSFCILMLGYAVSEEAYERTRFLETTNDGFKVSEFDLELRGPGQFMGTQQSGLTGFQLASLVRDQGLLQEARESAFEILRQDPLLKKPENKYLREELLRVHGPLALASIG